jgi:hypothetical protein
MAVGPEPAQEATMINLISFLLLLAIPVICYWMAARAADAARSSGNAVVHRFGAAAFARTRP